MGKKNKRSDKRPPRPETTILTIVLTLLPAVFLLGIRTFAGPCVHEDGSASACTTTGHVLLGVGAVALILGMLRLFGADKRTRRCFDLLLVVAGLALAILPGTALPLCMMATMRCRSLMLPFARVMGAAVAIGAFACELTEDHEEPTGRRRRR